MFEDFKALFIRRQQKHPQTSASQEPNMDLDFSLQNAHSNQTPKPEIIVIANQKGGCGKTTTAINLAAALAHNNFQVLLIDLDAQSHASLGLGIDVDRMNFSIYDVIVKNIEMEHIILPSNTKNLYIAPANPILTGAQLEIADLLGREMILKTALYKMINTGQRMYDYIIIDCSPSLNLLTINGFVASHLILVPIQTHYFAVEGMRELFSTINIVKDRLNAQLEILGILPTLFDSRTNMNKEILNQIKDYFKEKVFNTVVRMNIKLAEAQAYKKSIFEYDKTSNGAKDYLSLAEEVIALTKPTLKVLGKDENGEEPEREKQNLDLPSNYNTEITSTIQ